MEIVIIPYFLSAFVYAFNCNSATVPKLSPRAAGRELKCEVLFKFVFARQVISSEVSPYGKQDRNSAILFVLYEKLDKLPGALWFGTLHPGTILIILANSMPKLEKHLYYTIRLKCDLDSNAKKERDGF